MFYVVDTGLETVNIDLTNTVVSYCHTCTQAMYVNIHIMHIDKFVDFIQIFHLNCLLYNISNREIISPTRTI